MLDSVLVANRGEIARRVVRTARRMGIRAVAVYSDADADLPYGGEADQAVRIGPAQPAKSYLDAAAIIDAARKTGAESYDETWLNHDLAALDASQLGDYLTPLAQGLNAQGKETFVEQVARIGLADGPLTGPEMQVLESLSAALGISAAHLRGIVVSTTTGPQLPSSGDGPPDEYRRN